MFKTYSMMLAGRPLTIETGKMALLANGAVLVRYGDTVVISTATASKAPRDGIDFFPLSVDYEEKLYAVGKIPGGFIKREGKPSEKAILTSRVIDRPIRPLTAVLWGLGTFAVAVVIQSLSRVRLFATLETALCDASLSFTISRSLLKLMAVESVMPSNHLIFCHPLLLLPSIFPSIRVFSNELALQIRWSKYWSFSFSISPSNEYSGLISSRMDWLDLLAVQGTLKSLLQHHSSKASVLRCSA